MKKIILCLGMMECAFSGIGNYAAAMEREESDKQSTLEGTFIDKNQAKEMGKGLSLQLRKIEKKSEDNSEEEKKEYVDFFGSDRQVIGLYTSRGNDNGRFGTFLQLIALMLGVDRLCLMPDDTAIRPDKFLYSYENGDDGYQKLENIKKFMLLGLLSEVITEGYEDSKGTLTHFCGPDSVIWKDCSLSDSIIAAAYTHSEFWKAYNLLLKEMIWDNCNNDHFSIVKECLPIFLIQNLLYTDDHAYETLSSAIDRGFSVVLDKKGKKKEEPLCDTINRLMKGKYGLLLNAVNGGNFEEAKKWLSGYVLFGLIGSGKLEDIKFFMESVADDDEFLQGLVNILSGKEEDSTFGDSFLTQAKSVFVGNKFWGRLQYGGKNISEADFLVHSGLCSNKSVLKEIKDGNIHIAKNLLIGGFCLSGRPDIQNAIAKNPLMNGVEFNGIVDMIKKGEVENAKIRFITNIFRDPPFRRMKQVRLFGFTNSKRESELDVFKSLDFPERLSNFLNGCQVSRNSYLFKEIMQIAESRQQRRSWPQSGSGLQMRWRQLIESARELAEEVVLKTPLVFKLAHAIKLRKTEHIFPILEEGADILFKDNNSGVSAIDLVASCEYGEYALLILLQHAMNNRIDIFKVMDKILQNAASSGYTDAVRLMLEYATEEDVEIKDTTLHHALQNAASSGYADVMRLILEYATEEDVEIEDTTLHHALQNAASSGYAEVVRLMLEYATEEDVEIEDTTLCDTLQNAASSGHMDVVSLILDYATDEGVTLSNKTVEVILENAELLGRTDVVDFIIEQGFLDNIDNPVYRALLGRLRRMQTQNQAELENISGLLRNTIRRIDNLDNSNS